jgi:hypothetical protein
MPDKTNPNVRKIRAALAKIERGKALKLEGELARNQGVAVLLDGGWSVSRIAAEFAGVPGMSTHNISRISGMRRGG